MLLAQQEVTFRLKVISDVHTVHVVGDFNNWSKTAHPMQDSDGDDSWETMISLKPGKYEYRFLIDGTKWIKDPKNLHWGGERSNSILWVKTAHTPEVENIKPETGSIIFDSQIPITALYRDGIGRFGLDLKNSQVLLNGQKQNFRFNEDSHRIEILPGWLRDGEYQVEIFAQDNNANCAQKISTFFIVNETNTPPVADAGFTIIGGIDAKVVLHSGASYDPDKDQLVNYDWKFIQKPPNSKSKLLFQHTPFPEFTPDKVGRYVFTLQVSDGRAKSAVDTVDVYAFVNRDYLVKFQLADSVYAKIYETSINSVAVAGEFNRWEASALPMNDYNHDGVWSVWLKLDPGEYEYKFVVNGKNWITDPANPAKVADGWNGFNSIVYASVNFAPVIRMKFFFMPGKIIFDAAASYSQIGEKLNFCWLQDINNPQQVELPSLGKIILATPHIKGTYFYYLVATDQTGNSTQKTLMLNVRDGKVKISDFSDSPEWATDAIIYEVFVSQFSPEGDLPGLFEKIPYLKSLGINCLWLLPLYDGPTEHGYAPTNFFSINKKYGANDDYKFFLDQAHQAGIKVIFDFVANHSSDVHPYFLAAYANRHSVFRDWYRWHEQENNQSYYSYEFHNDWDTLPNLNYGNPAVRKYILEVAEFWAALGVDGFRCDAAWAVSHDFWKLFRRTVKSINPDILLIDEALPRSPAFHKDEFDMSYDTDFYGNLLDVFDGKKPLSAIEYGLAKTKKNYPPHSLDLRYLENHDMERFITKYGAHKTKLAAVLLFTISGTPLIYYGQEIGQTDQRTAMNWLQQNREWYDFYNRLILLRRSTACFRHGETIKVNTNFNSQVLAYLRHQDEERYLIILNFGEAISACQLFLPEKLFKNNWQLTLENVLTNEQFHPRWLQNRQIKLNLNQEACAVLKIIND